MEIMIKISYLKRRIFRDVKRQFKYVLFVTERPKAKIAQKIFQNSLIIKPLISVTPSPDNCQYDDL